MYEQLHDENIDTVLEKGIQSNSFQIIVTGSELQKTAKKGTELVITSLR